MRANVAEIDGQGSIKRRKKGEALNSDIPCSNIVHVSSVCMTFTLFSVLLIFYAQYRFYNLTTLKVKR